MTIRKARIKDSKRIVSLLSQVLELHAEIRPDIFQTGTTKYTETEVEGLINNENRRTYVAVDENDELIGFALCEVIKINSHNMVPRREMYIDDICVDGSARGQRIGTQLFEYVKEEARKLGCYEITLNVWEGNDSARAFYDKMNMKPRSTMMEIIL
ncbi:MAG: GNAT family N-acetyltransferase [Eubacterium sp.]|nr:GNAT family N-acetyltransferase [Eubacterium sp.]